jgi:signal peptidase I
MICRDNFHVSRSTVRDDQVFSGDRLLVAKFLKPNRWDLVVFRAPPSLQSEEQDTPTNFVMRLVGLPGEEVTLREGQVWINGQVLTAPAAIRGIKYDTDLNHSPGYVWGSPDSPAKLADDEYYVLGDFSRNSYDSRLWPEGKNSERPFAVPKADIQGVVSHIYWPLSRWRTFK